MERRGLGRRSLVLDNRASLYLGKLFGSSKGEAWTLSDSFTSTRQGREGRQAKEGKAQKARSVSGRRRPLSLILGLRYPQSLLLQTRLGLLGLGGG